MTDETKRVEDRRRAAVTRGMAELAADPLPDLWHYISFVDDSRPPGDQFIGGMYVRGASIEAALTRSHLLRVNPGGEAMCVGPVSTAQLDKMGVAEKDRERLLTRVEV